MKFKLTYHTGDGTAQEVEVQLDAADTKTNGSDTGSTGLEDLEADFNKALKNVTVLSGGGPTDISANVAVNAHHDTLNNIDTLRFQVLRPVTATTSTTLQLDLLSDGEGSQSGNDQRFANQDVDDLILDLQDAVDSALSATIADGDITVSLDTTRVFEY